jgi:tetratricopeptide (TPR) repeat protein/DNA polymerase III delta prime subunit
MKPQSSDAVDLFISYAHKDKKLCEQLIKHLYGLQREGVIDGWYDRDIGAGAEFHEEILAHIRRAKVILLLVSPDFMESDYINDVEVREAIELHRAEVAKVIPVILCPVDWHKAPFGELKALPDNGRAITTWRNRNEAFLDVVNGVREAVGDTTRLPDGCKGVPLIPRPPSVGFVPRRDRGHDLVRYLVDTLKPGTPRFIMLSGLEGVGKTKLAAEVARQLEADYQNCVVWSDGGKRVDYTIQSLLDDIAMQLGHSGLRLLPTDVKEERVSALVARQATLIVLDNYEAIAAEERSHIDEFFEDARCSVLYVSLRTKKGNKTADITDIRVLPMYVDESDNLIQGLLELTQNPELFTDDIRQRIYEVTEGRPALIEWIVKQIDVGEDEPEEVCRRAARGEGDVIQRILGRSFELLGKDGRATLLALSLFPSSATREALGAVVGLKEQRLKDAIWDLRTLMLIEMETQDKPLRFKVKGITRKLAAKLLSRDRRATAKYWRNFVKYYEVEVDKFEWAKCGPLAAPVAERSNLLRAVEFASYIGDWDTVLELYFKTKDHIPAFNAWRRAVDLAEREAEETLGDNENLPLPIVIEIKHEEIKKAQKYYQRLKKKSGRMGEKILKEVEENPSRVPERNEIPLSIELSVIEFESGVFAYHRGRYTDARKHFEKAKRYKRQAKDWRGLATVCNNLGLALAKERQNGRMEQACVELKESLKHFKKEKSKFAKVVSRNLKWLKCEARNHNPPEGNLSSEEQS